MRKLLCLLCACVLLMTAGCGKKNDDDTALSEPPVTEEVTPTPTPTPEPFQALVPESPAVASEWFDDALFIGDSVTLGLSLYCGENLGKAQFLCAGSMSATNLLSGLIVPTFQGQSVSLAEGVTMSGASKIYIMLGMNNIAFGVDEAAADMLTVISQVLEANPDVTIIIQSVTPMASTSNIAGRDLNNDNIRAYNAKMQELCQENEWYFVNVAEVMTGEDGCLRTDVCSDPNDMGIHVSAAGVAVWIDYLKTHTPAL
ncbi:MAG: GDSL-type esterase/lipase family protein [Oscillospiraceae bacterium]|nr:GDSL-type esterase/lipase family protein [Oscillospiraceae bacterium]